MSALWSALLSTAIGALLVLASYGDPAGVAAAALFLQYLIASGPQATGDDGRRIPTPRFTPVIAGSIAAVVVTVRPRTLGDAAGGGMNLVDQSVFTGVPIGLAVGFFVAIVAQMMRRDGRPDLVRSLAHVTLLLIVAVLAVGWIGAARTVLPLGADSTGIVAVVAAAMGVALIVSALLRREGQGTLALVSAVASMILPLLLAALAALAVGHVYDLPVSAWPTAMIGALVGVFAIVGRDVAASLSQTLRHAGPRWGFTGAFPVALVGPLAFIAGQLHGL